MGQVARLLGSAPGRSGVEFVVGGLAVNAWGVVRGTKDVDVVVAPDIENLKWVAVSDRRALWSWVAANVLRS